MICLQIAEFCFLLGGFNRLVRTVGDKVEKLFRAQLQLLAELRKVESLGLVGKRNDRFALFIREGSRAAALDYADIVDTRQQIEVFKGTGGLRGSGLSGLKRTVTEHFFNLIAAVRAVPAGTFIEGALAE